MSGISAVSAVSVVSFVSWSFAVVAGALVVVIGVEQQTWFHHRQCLLRERNDWCEVSVLLLLCFLLFVGLKMHTQHTRTHTRARTHTHTAQTSHTQHSHIHTNTQIHKTTITTASNTTHSTRNNKT